MMSRVNASRSRYGSDNVQEVSKAEVTKPSASTKRTALGDITNAVTISNKDKVGKVSIPVVTSVDPMEEVEDDNVETDATDPRLYMQRPSDDIDARDAENPILATTYVNEMYDQFVETERKFMVNPTYMSAQTAINERMRSILVDWLVEVHLKFKMVPETLYLTTNIIDRFLELKQVRKSKLQLVGVAALLVAAKYEEIYPPEFRDLVYITDRAYQKQEILEMESEIVNTLQYNFTVPTAHSFLCRYLKAAHADRTMVQLACYLAERSLQEYSAIRFLPSTIAATAVLIARKSLKRHPWSPTLLKYTKYDEADLSACAEEMRQFTSNTSSPQQAVYRKYSSPKFGQVAKMPVVI